MSSIILNPFQLLELNIISGQDLANVSRSMRTYAVAWVHPDRKLSTRVDSKGRCNPTWNDKFVFRVDDEFLRSETSAIMIEIYSVHWFKDVLVGTVRVMVGNLPTPPPRPFRPQHQIGMRFVALQVRRPSGRPQGILNVGISILDSSMRSMPLYNAGSSAVGYHDLIGDNQKKKKKTVVKLPDLRRTKSDTSSIQLGACAAAGAKTTTLRRKVSFREKLNSVINATNSSTTYSVQDRAAKVSLSKRSSVMSDSYIASNKMRGKKGKKDGSILGFSPILRLRPNSATNMQQTKMKQKKRNSDVVLDFESTNNKPGGNKLLYHLTESELGPSPSEMAAQLAAKEKYKLNNDGESSILGGWSQTGSVEGLQSKLERWRMELPPVYDPRGGGDSSSNNIPTTTTTTTDRDGDGGQPPNNMMMMKTTNAKGSSNTNTRNGRHARRNTDTMAGLFSCVSNICGCECSIVCGDDPSKPS